MILKTIKQLILSLLLSPLLVFADNKATLIFGYGDHNAAPYAIERSEQLFSGIIKDIATEISGELDIDIAFVKTPRKRIERYLESNTIHVELITNPAWLGLAIVKTCSGVTHSLLKKTLSLLKPIPLILIMSWKT